MNDERCTIEVGSHVGPYWHGDGIRGTGIVCDRHKRQFEDAYDDYSGIVWTLAEDGER